MAPFRFSRAAALAGSDLPAGVVSSAPTDAMTGGPVLAVQLRAGSTKGEIAGYGSAFDVLDHNGFVIRRGAFEASLAKRMPVLLWGHDPKEPIGKWTHASEDARGLRVRGRINLETERGREAFSLLSEGSISGLSIGGNIAEAHFEKDVRVITALDLFEVSVVSIPANEAARVESVTATAVSTPRDLERFLRAAGFSRGDARAITSGGWKYLNRHALPDDSAEVRALAGLAAHIRQSTQTLRF